MGNKMPRPIKLVIFDLYGTLIKFGIKRHPYRKILTWARDEGRSPQPSDARVLMTLSSSPKDVLAEMGISPPESMLAQLHIDINEELASLTLFEDVLPTLNELLNLDVGIAVCSNLAQPYGAVIDRLIPGIPMLRCLSYEVGFIKPELGIYQWIVDESGVAPESCFFVGDTLLADCTGPFEFGFNARHLVRGEQSNDTVIGSLTDVINLI